MKQIEELHKKAYVKPTFQLIELHEPDIICTSEIPEFYGPLA